MQISKSSLFLQFEFHRILVSISQTELQETNVDNIKSAFEG